jgi:hypothetical protein
MRCTYLQIDVGHHPLDLEPPLLLGCQQAALALLLMHLRKLQHITSERCWLGFWTSNKKMGCQTHWIKGANHAGQGITCDADTASHLNSPFQLSRRQTAAAQSSLRSGDKHHVHCAAAAP